MTSPSCLINMEIEDLQKEMDSLPRQDSDFVIGWLMAQVVHLSKELEKGNSKTYEEHQAHADRFDY